MRMFYAFKRVIHQRIEFADGTPVFESRQVRMTSIGTGWTTLALINAALAGNDGGSSLGTFLLSLGLGPIVTLYLALTSGQRVKDLERILDISRR